MPYSAWHFFRRQCIYPWSYQCWLLVSHYIYILTWREITIFDHLSRYLYTLDKTSIRTKTDQTLEVIMTDLDREKMKIFYQEYTSSATEATKVSASIELWSTQRWYFQKAGIDRIFPNAKIFDYLFDPCGYSMNGLLPDGHYFTIHITPEPDFSYVSFETNVPSNQYNELIRKVINMFNPGKVTTTIFGGSVSSKISSS